MALSALTLFGFVIFTESLSTVDLDALIKGFVPAVGGTIALVMLTASFGV